MMEPTEGTRLSHVAVLLTGAVATLADARVTVRGRLKPAEREALSRELAGVVAICETVRIWLRLGAPQ